MLNEKDAMVFELTDAEKRHLGQAVTEKTEVKAEVKPEVKPEVKTEEKKKLVADAFIDKAKAKAAEEAKVSAELPEDVKKELESLKAEKIAREQVEKETEALNEIKKTMGAEFDNIESKVAELIESDTYDKLKAAGFDEKQRLLMLIDLAKNMTETPSIDPKAKAIKEAQNESLPQSVKDVNTKKTQAELMNEWKTTGNDALLNEALGIDDDLKKLGY